MKKIKLTKGLYALVDDKDFERVNAHKWYATLDSRGTKWYAKRHCKKHERKKWRAAKIRLHHFVLDIVPHKLPPGCVVDHGNDDGLDCLRGNLRVMTQTANMAKSHGWKKKGQKWPGKRRKCST
jgi:hypothetical protein